ncbi:MAG: hypothetical protein ABW168_25155 [Sedimenticola sp.]
MLSQSELIGSYASADRVWSGRFWPLYLVVLFAVELHGVVGLYRLAVKWSPFGATDPLCCCKPRSPLSAARWQSRDYFLRNRLLTLSYT